MKVPATISRAVLQALEKFYRNHKPASPLERLTLPLSIYSGPLTGTPAALCTLRFVMAYEAGLACKVAQRDSDHWEPVYPTRTQGHDTGSVGAAAVLACRVGVLLRHPVLRCAGWQSPGQGQRPQGAQAACLGPSAQPQAPPLEPALSAVQHT